MVVVELGPDQCRRLLRERIAAAVEKTEDFFLVWKAKGADLKLLHSTKNRDQGQLFLKMRTFLREISSSQNLLGHIDQQE